MEKLALWTLAAAVWLLVALLVPLAAPVFEAAFWLLYTAATATC